MCQKNKFKIALCQIKVEDDEIKNLNKATECIKEASENGASIVSLGEMFICPYDNDSFVKYAKEEKDNIVLKELGNLAKESNIYIIAGSIPEKEEDKYYNTSYIFDYNGNIIGKHRKIHLFDIDIKDKIYMKESDTFSYGDSITVIDTKYCKIGVAICYDMRFPEIFRIMVDKGVKLIVVPAAFNNVTGPMHWHTTIKARAIDNQVYFAGVSPATNYKGNYLAYGHSLISDPLGNIICEADDKETICYGEIDLNHLENVREELPLLKHRRLDIYNVNTIK